MNKCRFEKYGVCQNENCMAYYCTCPVKDAGYEICKYSEEQKLHELKILPKYFEDVNNYDKTFEVRKNDRDFKIGDKLLLREWDGEYKGKQVYRSIVYILKDDVPGIEKGYCILGIDR